ncbi:OX-2 membrane glycoprotein-like isoform X2 [Rhinatrema bivittatum]|nr:OX-2 membrane glycoprotein-like isoform X2 [Rhinatrema bivittatum]XP_029434553.1 OX-2 membrane glycoprotein-like isoform X2 [Rhinatrema bivittatum]
MTATAGEKVTIQCQLLKAQDVLQVTWQKDTGDLRGNVATYSKSYGEVVMKHYRHRHIRVVQEEPNASAMTFGAVGLRDEGCYKCIFNIYPTGSITGRTCLEVYAISGPRLETHLVSVPESSGEVQVISCSARGKPAPVISWNLTENLLEKPQEYSITHPDQTVTVISNFTQLFSRGLQQEVVMCVLRHPALNVEISLPRNLSEASTEGSGSAAMTATSIVLASVTLTILLLMGLVLWKRHEKHKKTNHFQLRLGNFGKQRSSSFGSSHIRIPINTCVSLLCCHSSSRKNSSPNAQSISSTVPMLNPSCTKTGGG